jgi:hypothetical protein
MKVLYFDLEHGSQTLGSQSAIQKKFGYNMLSPGTWDAFQSIIGKLYTKKNVLVEKKIGSITIPEEQEQVILRDGVSIDALVIDTFSELSKKFMRKLSDKEGKMKLQNWGQLKNNLDRCLDFVSRIPGVVICNCHGKIQTMDDGVNKVLPYIDGSTKEDISKWFDFVFYTGTMVNPSGVRDYVWHTQRTEKYDNAKDRTGLLDSQIPQDYQLVLKAAKKAGFDGLKILVIGSPGSGKTYSLSTLVGNTTKVPVSKAKQTKITNGVHVS